MRIEIFSAISETRWFALVFLALLLASIQPRGDEDKGLITPDDTNELKGVAILAVIFGHIGYFLSADTNFLFPFSVMSGVGVDIFLFLSGFGLASSLIRKKQSVLEFYKKRLSKLVIPFWLTLTIFLVADYFFLHKNYQLGTVVRNFFGFFPRADLYEDINSPLWFITLIISYYLVLPIVFWRRFPYVTALILFVAGDYITKHDWLHVDSGVLDLYKLHILAFPVGIAVAALVRDLNLSAVKRWFLKFNFQKWPAVIWMLKFFVAASALAVFGYLAYFSGVGQGQWVAERRSMATVLVLTLFFLLKRFRFKLFEVFGRYSFEIYLLHWPLLYRYDFLYKKLPGAAATLLYLGLFLLSGFILQKICNLATIEKIRGHLFSPKKY